MPLPYFLRTHDKVALIAPASRCTEAQLSSMQALLSTWGLNCVIPDDLFGETLFYANTDEIRLRHLKEAINDDEIKAIFIVRGGYGSLRLIPHLMKEIKPTRCKLFIGMSDTTALQLFFQQSWQWISIHASAAPDRFDKASLESLRQILFGEKKVLKIANLEALNTPATKCQQIIGELIGGNLAIVMASIATGWQLQAKNKIVFLEEVGERGYQIDRMLEQASQVQLFQGARAILFGDFYKCHEPDGKDLSPHALIEFAKKCEIPVYRASGLGHAPANIPLPLGLNGTIKHSESIDLLCDIQ